MRQQEFNLRQILGSHFHSALLYGGMYQGHHFWALSRDAVMAAAGIPNCKTLTEDIQIGYYTNSCVEIRDPVTRSLKANFVAVAKPESVEQPV